MTVYMYMCHSTNMCVYMFVGMQTYGYYKCICVYTHMHIIHMGFPSG